MTADLRGTTTLVKKSAIKQGTIAVGKNISVAWGKVKKSYNAKVISSSGAQTPATPAVIQEEEPFTFELAAPAQTPE